jgi:hypothetical protein
MTTTTQTEEDGWEGRLKCNVCGDYQRDHKLGRTYCLKKGCDCLSFAKPGGLG